MKKIINAISLALAIALLCCIGIFAAACDGNGDNNNDTTNPNAYTVTVLMPDGTAVDGTSSEFENTWIQVCLTDGACSMYEGTLDKDGKCTFTKEEVNLDGDTYVIHVLSLPAGYSADTVTLTETSRTGTITLKNS